MRPPGGWRKLKIGQLGKIVTGKTPPTSRAELFGDKYPFITPTDISDSLHTVKTARYLSEEGRQFQKNNLLPAGAVCYTCIASIGKICITTEPSFTNQQINSIIVDSNEHDHRFVYHLLRNETERIKPLASGAAAPIISKSSFSEIEVRVPPLPTQRRIASILSAYDDLIENNTRRIKLLEEMARLIYREWFVEFRAPGVKLRKATPEEKKVTGKDVFPVGWEVSKLGDISDVNPENITKGQEPETIMYVDIASVSTGQIDNIEEMAFANAPGRARRMVRHGDIIWSCVRPNRKAYNLILNPPPNLIVSTGFAVIRGKNVPFTYLYHALTTDEFVGYLTNHARGAAYPAVTGTDFEAANVVIPADTLLKSFHDSVADMSSMRQNLQAKNTNLRQTRDLLLPKLVSGEVAV